MDRVNKALIEYLIVKPVERRSFLTTFESGMKNISDYLVKHGDDPTNAKNPIASIEKLVSIIGDLLQGKCRKTSLMYLNRLQMVDSFSLAITKFLNRQRLDIFRGHSKREKIRHVVLQSLVQ